MQTIHTDKREIGIWPCVFLIIGIVAFLCLTCCDANAEAVSEKEEIAKIVSEEVADKKIDSFKISDTGSFMITSKNIQIQLQNRILSLELELLATKEWMRCQGLPPEEMDAWRLDLQTKTFVRK